MKWFIMLFKNCDLNSLFKNVRPNLCKLVSHILKLFFLRCLLNFSFTTIGMFYFSYQQLAAKSIRFCSATVANYIWKERQLYFDFSPCRDVREYKSRVESYSREILRKEAQIKELQNRLENGEGSKSQNLFFCSTAKSTSSSSTISF